MLKMGGTAAVIVPSGVIQNSGKAFEALRKMLIEKTELRKPGDLGGSLRRHVADGTVGKGPRPTIRRVELRWAGMTITFSIEAGQEAAIR